MIKLPPEKILNEEYATAIVELKESIHTSDFRIGMKYLDAGTRGWTDMVWYDNDEENECGWITGYMVHPFMGSGKVRFNWLSDGSSQSAFVYPKDLKVIKKLKSWGKILKYGCPTM